MSIATNVSGMVENATVKVSKKDFKYIRDTLKQNGFDVPNICETLLEKYLSISAGDRMMPNEQAVQVTIEIAQYLKDDNNLKYCVNDIIIRVLSDIMKLHCCVLNRGDICKDPSTASFRQLKVAANRHNKRLGYSDQSLVWTFKLHVIK